MTILRALQSLLGVVDNARTTEPMPVTLPKGMKA